MVGIRRVIAILTLSSVAWFTNCTGTEEEGFLGDLPLGHGPSATEAFAVPGHAEGFSYADPAFDSQGGFLLNAGVNVVHVSDSGFVTHLLPIGEMQQFVLDPQGRRFGSYSQDHFEIRDLTGDVVLSLMPESGRYALFVPGGDLVYFPRVGGDPFRSSTTHARFYDLAGALYSEFPVMGIARSFPIGQYMFYTTQSEVVKVGLSGAEEWRVPLSLARFEVSINGQLAVGLLSQQGVVQVVHIDLNDGSVLGSTVLDSALWNIAIAPSGRYSALTTQQVMYRFDGGQLSDQTELPVEWAVSVDVRDDGLVAVGAQLENHDSQVFLIGPPGTKHWTQIRGLKEYSGYRPSARFFPTSSRLSLNESTGISVLDVEW